MAELDQRRRRLLSFHLVTFNNPKAKRLVIKNNIGSGQFFELSGRQLTKLGFTEAEIHAIRAGPDETAEHELAKAHRQGISLIFKDDADYPPLLSDIYDPPEFIYFSGNRQVLNKTKIAVVGSRHASTYGAQTVKRLLPDVCRAGLVVVSGMAYGIDSMAHQAALTEKTGTIGINAGGLLHLYPQGNRALIRAIIDQGGIMSEFPLDTVARPFLFPIRNRLIAGISRAVLIVEATMRSGSLITARLALEQGRDIMAVPGRVDSPLSAGCHYLIQQGAKLISASQDILDEFGIQLKKAAPPSMAFSPKEKQVLDLLGVNEVKSLDYFVENLDFSTPEIISLLMGLILKNVICEQGGMYQRVYHG